ncbi:MAG: hypothetical protein IPF73_13225 [Betaproteobacteria bacterium]|nr:hypothetical protein [Betaproteobacteria bacterium]
MASEILAKESLASARLLMEKLYRRNPREWRKGHFASADAAVATAFDPQRQFNFPELHYVRGSDAIVLALRVDHPGDRVFVRRRAREHDLPCLRRQDRVLHHRLPRCPEVLQLGAQRRDRGGSSRNARDPGGGLLILSNEMAGAAPNLSFERELGKIIACQDVMALIAAQRANRTIRRVVQTLATAVFLPI